MSEPSLHIEPLLYPGGGEPLASVEDRRRGRFIEIAIRALTTQLGSPPSDEQIAAELGLELQGYQDLLESMKGLSLGLLRTDNHSRPGEESLTYRAGKRDDDPTIRCSRREMMQTIADAIERLRRPERLFFALYYYEELSIQEIGLALDMPESEVWRLRASALLHLRAKMADLAG